MAKKKTVNRFHKTRHLFLESLPWPAPSPAPHSTPPLCTCKFYPDVVAISHFAICHTQHTLTRRHVDTEPMTIQQITFTQLLCWWAFYHVFHLCHNTLAYTCITYINCLSHTIKSEAKTNGSCRFWWQLFPKRQCEQAGGEQACEGQKEGRRQGKPSMQSSGRRREREIVTENRLYVYQNQHSLFSLSLSHTHRERHIENFKTSCRFRYNH